MTKTRPICDPEPVCPRPTSTPLLEADRPRIGALPNPTFRLRISIAPDNVGFQALYNALALLPTDKARRRYIQQLLFQATVGGHQAIPVPLTPTAQWPVRSAADSTPVAGFPQYAGATASSRPPRSKGEALSSSLAKLQID